MTVGPTRAIRLLAVRDTPLSVDEVLAAVADPGAGGTVACSSATVRDEDGGKTVDDLGYSAHPSVDAARCARWPSRWPPGTR